jgi:hypothetical protein
MSPVLTALVVFAVLGILQALLSNRPGSSAEVETSLAGVTPPAWPFVAMQYHLGILNRTYVVFVSERSMCGARVRGPLLAPVQVTSRWNDPFFYPRPALLAKCVGVDLESEKFLATDRANFRLRKDDVAVVEFTTESKWGMGAVPYSGRLLVTRKDRTRMELILLGIQDGRGLCDRLRAEGFGASDSTRRAAT